MDQHDLRLEVLRCITRIELDGMLALTRDYRQFIEGSSAALPLHKVSFVVRLTHG